MKIEKVVRLYREFGFKVAFASFCSSAFSHPMAITRWKERVLINWIRKNYSGILKKYKNSTSNESDEVSNIIWSIWWQGEENAPEIVKKCLASVRQYCGDKDFRIITKNNFRDYIKIPEFILKKVDDGVISLTHFSDILRFYLLYNYGGLWLDATILVTKKIPEEIFSRPYFTVKRNPKPRDFNVAQRRWAGFLQAAHRKSNFCGFVHEVLLECWRTHTQLFDYVFMDYVIALAVEELQDFRTAFDEIPLSNPEIDSLVSLLNLPYDEEKFAALTSETTFFKLDWRYKFEKNISGSETFYGHVISQTGNGI